MGTIPYQLIFSSLQVSLLVTKISNEKYSITIVHFNYLALQQVTHLRQVMTSHGHLQSLGCLGGGMVIIT